MKNRTTSPAPRSLTVAIRAELSAHRHLAEPSRTPRPLAQSPLLPLGAACALLMLVGENASAQSPATQAVIGSAAEEATLPTVKVREPGLEEEESYQAVTTRVGKVPQELRDIPQSVTVVTRQLIEDRNADTLKEALRNVAGVTFNAGEGGRIGDNITIRGYSAVGDLYLDGMRDVAQYNREVFNLEQIDVLRGSASMLFGRGSTGGIVNQASKLPFLGDRSEFALTGGSHEYGRSTLDVNHALGATTAVRVNGMYTHDGSFRDGPEYERWGIAPSIGFGLGTDNELTLAYFHLEDDNIPDMGQPYFQGRPLDVPVDRFYGLVNADRERNETGIATLVYQHRFAPDTSLRTALRAADYERFLWATAPRLASPIPAVINDDTRLNRQRQARAGEEDSLFSQTDFTTVWSAGRFEHQLLLGLELAKERARRWSFPNTAHGAPANPGTTVGNVDPAPALPAGYGDQMRIGEVRYESETAGLYFQDVLQFAPRWKLLLGARYDDFSADYYRPEPQGDLSRTDHVWSYRTGLIHQPSDAQSYYISYGTSFNPSAELYQLDDRSANTAPEKSRNMEIGARWDLLDGDLSVRTALARSEKTDERNTDLAIPDVFLLAGRRYTDSLELEVIGRITPGWQVFASAAYMDAEITRASFQQAGTRGNVPGNTPDHTASLWTQYELGGGWSIGGGIESVGKRYANNSNVNVVPGYMRWDASVGYERELYAVRLNIVNLLDERYYEGVYGGHVVPGTSRAAQLKMEFKF